MRYSIIGDEDTVLGFKMVGVSGEAEQALSGALEDREVGIVLITERVAELMRAQVDQYVFTRSFPLIVEIPDRRGPVAGKPGIREMVNRAIGIKL